MPKLSDITYKLVLNKNADLEAVELWQDDNYITVSLAGEGTHDNHSRWEEVRTVMNRLQDEQFKRVTEGIGAIYGDIHD